MSYSVNSTTFQVTLNAGTTELNLAGLTGLVDSSGNSIVTTAGGDQGSNGGNQKLYTLHHPYVFKNSGTLTITPDDEQLFIENTNQRDNLQDFRLENGSTTIIAGEYVKSYGTYYSVATWLRINRASNDTYRVQKAIVFVHRGAALDWRGGVAMGGAVVHIDGGNSGDAVKNISNATWVGRNTNQFSIRYAVQNYTATNFSIIYNRLVDGRSNTNTFGYTAINSLLEGNNGQVYENYSGTVNYATWTRDRSVRLFLNNSFGMNLPVTVFGSNKTQQGGVIKVSKSATLKLLDIARADIDGVQVAVKAYNNGDRIDYKNQPSATSGETSRYTNQTLISDILGTTNSSGEFSFTKLLKEYTCRDRVTFFSYDTGGFTGAFTAGDDINVTTSNRTRIDGEFLYHDVAAKLVYFFRTRNLGLFYSSLDSMINLSQTGEVTFNDVTLDQNINNAVARFTEGGNDASPVGDVLALKYGKQLTISQLNYGGLNRLESTIFMLDDSFITEKDPLIVAAYTELGNTNKAYDRIQYYFDQNWQQEAVLICNFISGFLDFGLNSVVLDGTQATALTISGTTYTLGIGSSKFVGNIKGASVTLVNGATTSGIINSGGIITLPDLNVSITSIIAGSRLQIFNVTTNLEVKNEMVAGTTYAEAYEEGSGYSDGDVIRVRLSNAITTTAYLGLETTVIASATGWSVLANQQLDTVYNSIGIDGSTVTKFSADYSGVDVELNIAQNFTIHEFYVWWIYNQSTGQSIRQFFNGITALNTANIRINVDILNLYLDSTINQSVRQTDNVRIFRSDLAYPVRQPTTSGYGLDVNWQNEVFVVGVNVNVPALTSAQSTQLGNITDVLADTNELQANQGNFATATTTVSSNMRGTDNANTVTPLTPPTVVEIRAGFVANDFKATETVSSNMRGTDGAITSVTGLSTFNPVTDTVANVTLVNTVTTNTDMRGTDGANTIAPDNSSITTILSDLTTYTTSALPKIRAILVDTDELQINQGDWITATGFSTFNNTVDEVITNTASRNASKGLTANEGVQLTNINIVTKLIPGLF